MRLTGPLAVTAAAMAVACSVIAFTLFGRQLNALFIALPGIDKAFHLAGYFVLYIAIHAVSSRALPGTRKAGWIAAFVGVGVAGADELIQRFSPGRNAEGLDIVAGCAGMALGWVVAVRPSRRLAVVTATVAIAVASYAAYDTYIRLIDYSLALRYERRHDFKRARTHYLQALNTGLRSPALFNALGWVEIESGEGNPRKAVEYASIALREDPDNPDVLDTYGWALHHAGRSEAALEYLAQAYATKPDMFCIHYHLGEAYFAVGRVDLAAAHYQKQLQHAGTREARLAAQRLAVITHRRASSGPEASDR